MTISNYLHIVGYILLIALQFAVPISMKSRIESSIGLKYNSLLEEYRYEIKVREQAARASEYLALATRLTEESPEEDYERADQLSWELAMWLPDEIYKSMTLAVASPSSTNNPLTVAVAIRKLLLKDNAGDLTANDIARHGPGIGKNEDEL